MKKIIKNKILIGIASSLAITSLFMATSCQTSKYDNANKTTIPPKQEGIKIKIIGIKPKASNLIKNISEEILNTHPLLFSTITKAFDNVNHTKFNKEFIAKKKIGVTGGFGIIILEAKNGYIFETGSTILTSNKFTLIPATSKDKTITNTVPNIPTQQPLPPTISPNTPPQVVPIVPPLLTTLTKSKIKEFNWENAKAITLDMFKDKMPNITAIENNAFEETNLQSINIPQSVIAIGDHAFAKNNLIISQISLPHKFHSISEKLRIGIYKIQSATSLTRELVISLGLHLNKKITKEELKAQFPYLTSINNRAFKDFQMVSFEVPKNVVSIGEYAFENCGLESINISDSVIEIGKKAFSANKITTLFLPDSIKHIGEYAFSWSNISFLKLPNFVVKIGFGAFQGNKLEFVDLPNSLTEISGGLFYDNLLTSITIPDGITSIDSFAFEDNELTSIIIPNSVQHISHNAFRGISLSKITKLGLPEKFNTPSEKSRMGFVK